MKNILHIVGAGIIVGLFTFTSMVSIAHADTSIGEVLNINSAVTWDRSGSPYVLNSDIVINPGGTLTISPGVEVRGQEGYRNHDILIAGGVLDIRGSLAERVSIHDLDSIFVSDGGVVTIENADLSNMEKALRVENSRTVVIRSSVTHSTFGIDLKNSSIMIQESRIASNTVGMNIQWSPGMMQVRDAQRSIVDGIGGIGNALDDLPTMGTYVNVTGSVFEDNKNNAVNNNNWLPAQFMRNWWGSSTGPSISSGTNSVVGSVEYSPWLTNEPDLFSVPSACCSSVLFIPGLEATRLYRDEPGLLNIGTSVNQLWEPNRNDDVRKLFLDANGSSTDTAIYSGAPIDKGLGIVGVYDTFMKYLDGLVANGSIGEWKSYGYDWRKPIALVVAGSERRATTTDTLIGTLEALAARSKTGKVTLIAHSNGGLVAKYLVKTLAEMGKANLIDSVISVAVPYLGTPQAILSLLHGDNQAMAGGLILNKSVARDLGTNMSSAYSLLPSLSYFSKIFGPTIAFASTTIFEANNGSYPKSIDSFSGQKAFILDMDNARSNAGSNTTIPSKGNSLLMNAAEILHGILDPYVWPVEIARWAIVGWGNQTTKAITYNDKTSCMKTTAGPRCSKTPIYSASTTSMGDGTVIAPSASYNDGIVTSLDLKGQSRLESRNFDHTNILEASSTKAIIGNILNTNSNDKNTNVISAISIIPNVKIGEPDYSKEPITLVLSTHSPVELHVYDSKGNHTGPTGAPHGMSEDVEDGLYTFSENNIIGSTYNTYGDESDPQTYISLPDTGSEKYSVVIDGTGVGEFTYDVERVRGGQVLDHVEYASLPVTPLTLATSTITTAVSDSNPPTIGLASSTPPLNIDVDGNGSADIIAKSNATSDPIMYLEAMKKTIITLLGSNTRGQNITKRIDKLEDLVKKGRLKQLRDNSEKLRNRIVHKKGKALSTDEKGQIVDMIDAFVAQFE